jgi:hypothetical protein
MAAEMYFPIADRIKASCGAQEHVPQSVVAWLPGPSKVESKIVALKQFRELLGDDREGQFKGQNGASECSREPVSADQHEPWQSCFVLP